MEIFVLSSDNICLHFLIHLFVQKYLEPGVILETRDIVMNKTKSLPP